MAARGAVSTTRTWAIDLYRRTGTTRPETRRVQQSYQCPRCGQRIPTNSGRLLTIPALRSAILAPFPPISNEEVYAARRLFNLHPGMLNADCAGSDRLAHVWPRSGEHAILPSHADQHVERFEAGASLGL